MLSPPEGQIVLESGSLGQKLDYRNDSSIDSWGSEEDLFSRTIRMGTSPNSSESRRTPNKYLQYVLEKASGLLHFNMIVGGSVPICAA